MYLKSSFGIFIHETNREPEFETLQLHAGQEVRSTARVRSAIFTRKKNRSILPLVPELSQSMLALPSCSTIPMSVKIVVISSARFFNIFIAWCRLVCFKVGVYHILLRYCGMNTSPQSTWPLVLSYRKPHCCMSHRSLCFGGHKLIASRSIGSIRE